MLKLQNAILEMVARSEDLASVADRLCREVERLNPDAVCSVLEVDPAGMLHPLAGPSLPDDYSAALDGIFIGPNVGSCGTAAYLGEAVEVTDIATDPKWVDFAELALPLGLRACWSSPICNGRGAVIGTFAFYYREKRGPSALEQKLVNTCLHLCAIAITNHRWQLEQQRRALEDSLTGLPNRAAFNAALAKLPCDQPGSWALLFVDLDNLKTINDTFGHHAGDRLIATAAARIAGVILPDKAYRLGGDEFALLMRSPAALKDLEGVAGAILAALSVPADCGGHLAVPRATIGGAVLSLGDGTSERVRQNADFALYHAKETSRGGFVRYWPGIGSRITRRLDAIRDVDAALGDHRLLPYYQPIYRIDTREIMGFEALCRIRLGDRVLAAAQFHEATTDMWIATALTERMLGLVAADIRGWLDAGLDVQHIGLNVSSADFHGGQLAEQLCRTFAAARVPLDRIILEVTETVYMGQADHVVAQQIRALRARGLRVALDDFGTGFASLTHLMTLPIDILKIDKTFVDQLLGSSVSRAIVEGLLHIAGELNVEVIAEGVETEEQAQLLRAAGCQFGQGYLFSPPVDVVEATGLLVGQRARPASVASLRR